MKKHRLSQPEHVLANYPPEVLILANQVRQLIEMVCPDAEERIYKGGRGIGYRTKEAGTFCGLFYDRNSIHLIFSHSMQLPDPEGLLDQPEQLGQQIVLRPGRAFPEEALADLIQASVLYGAARRDGFTAPFGT